MNLADKPAAPAFDIFEVAKDITRAHGKFLRGDVPHNKTHGMSNTKMFGIWRSMLARCNNPNAKPYPRYGGRGIKVCDRWQTFENFYADMGERPRGMSLERRDNNGGYCPSNCYWAPPRAQAQNTRKNRLLSHAGRTMCVAEWAREVGMKSATIRRRLEAGWDVARALTTPPEEKHRGSV